MKVRVLLFASLRERAGTSSLEIEVPEGSTAAAVWADLASRGPLAGAIARPGFALNHEWCDPGRALAEGDELALLPPVSGG